MKKVITVTWDTLTNLDIEIMKTLEEMEVIEKTDYGFDVKKKGTLILEFIPET